MAKACDKGKNIKEDIKKNPVQVAKERCLISQKLISNSKNSSKSNTECITNLKKVRINNISTVVATLNININSLVSKFDEFTVTGPGIFDILVINETKLDVSFRVHQFCITGFSTSQLHIDWIEIKMEGGEGEGGGEGGGGGVGRGGVGRG